MTQSISREVLGPEHQALLLLVDDDPANDEALTALLRGNVDWDALIALAQQERATAELYRRVRSLRGAEVPSEATMALQRLARVSDFRMLHLEQCLRETFEVLTSLGTRGMLLKGSALVYSVYGGAFARRPMSDIDVLVERPRADEAHLTLLRGRWKKTPVPAADEVYQEYHHHLPPLTDTRGTGVQLELHTALFAHGHPFGLTPEALWERSSPLLERHPESTLRAPLAFVPLLEHQLLHACIHFAWSHGMRFGAWRVFRDIRALVRTGAIDWDGFVDMAKATRSVTSCYWTFRLAHSAAGVRVPGEVECALRPPLPGAYLRRLERHYLLNLFPAAPPCPSVRLDQTLWSLGMLPWWSGHGPSRPWDRDESFSPPRDLSQVAGAANRMRQILRSTEYVGAVLGLGRFGKLPSR